MSTIDRQAIIETLSRLVTPGIKLTALADELGAQKQQHAALREVILDLVEDGTVQVLSGDAFALSPSGRSGDPAAIPHSGDQARAGEEPQEAGTARVRAPAAARTSYGEGHDRLSAGANGRTRTGTVLPTGT